MSLLKHKKDWEDLARLDPLWAILTDPKRQFGRWNPDEFFQTGDVEVQAILAKAASLGYPARKGAALDFGCGVGRLTRALANHFEKAIGIDISEPMIEKARELNRGLPRCEFRVNASNDLRQFPDASFDLIYTSFVLQHLPNEQLVRSYLAEFIRTLKQDGILIFQLPSHIPFLVGLQPRRKLYLLLSALGFKERFLYEKLRLNPMRMNYVPENHVTGFLEKTGAKLLRVEASTMPTLLRKPIQNRIYFAAKT